MVGATSQLRCWWILVACVK
jgi:hypothetical protein